MLALAEHITRKYIALKITGKTSFAVKEDITYIKEYYGTKFSQVFKIIISDNGRELSELSQMEKDTFTKIGLVHHYSSWKIGSNERYNGLLRRFIRKGKRMDNYSGEDIMFIANGCNALYKKKISDELFDRELDKIYASYFSKSVQLLIVI